jgi:hypothetical protein
MEKQLYKQYKINYSHNIGGGLGEFYEYNNNTYFYYQDTFVYKLSGSNIEKINDKKLIQNIKKGKILKKSDETKKLIKSALGLNPMSQYKDSFCCKSHVQNLGETIINNLGKWSPQFKQLAIQYKHIKTKK